MNKAIVIREHGGPSVLVMESSELPAPPRGEVQLWHTAIGLNFIDVYDRSGLYPRALPSGLGREAAGVISALGPGVRGWRVGQRVAYVHPTPGAYAQRRNVSVERLLRLPAWLGDEQAASIMLKGLTAQFLVRRTARLAAGQRIVVHAAAGGVGLLLCQWARSLGVQVIGVVGTEKKAALARRHGCHKVLLAGSDDLVAGVRAATRGAMVDVVYDSVGQDTFFQSLDCLKPRGLMVCYGNSSGPPPALSPLELSRRGSLFLTRPSLFDYIATRAELEAGARELFAAVRRGVLKVRIGQRFALEAAAQAHAELAARRTVGATVLIP